MASFEITFSAKGAKEVDTQIEKLLDSLRKTTDKVEGLNQYLSKAETAAKSFGSTAEKSTQGLSSAVASSEKQVSKLSDSLSSLANAVDDVNMNELVQDVGAGNAAIEKLSNRLNTSVADTRKITSSIVEFESALKSIQSTSGLTESEVNKLVSEFKNGVAANKQFADALGFTAEQVEQLSLELIDDSAALDTISKRLKLTGDETLELARKVNTGVDSFGTLIDELNKSDIPVSQFVSNVSRSETALKTLSDTTGLMEQDIRTLILTFSNGDDRVKEFAAALGIAESEARKLISAYSQAQSKVDPLIKSSQSLSSSYNVVSDSTQKAAKGLDNYVDASVKAKKSVDDLGNSVDNASGKIQEGAEVIATVAGAAFAGLALAGTKAIQTFQDFDQQLRQTAVISGATDSDFSLLEDTVRDLGIRTSATPRDIAALTQELARAGFTAQEQSKSLEGIIRASEATGESLSGLGGVIGQIIRTFSLGSDESERIADVLVAAANSTNTSVLELGEAFSYVGTQAVQTNQPVEEIALALGLLADAGLQGSAGGTALAEALRRLSLSSAGVNSEFNDLVRGQEKMGQAFATLNSDIRDSNGQLLPLSEILTNLKAKFDQLGSQEDKEIIANALFGVQGGRGFLSLMNQVDTRLVEVGDNINNSTGLARASGEAMLTSLSGSMKLLGSSIDTLLIDLGAFIAQGLQPMVDAATGLLNGFLAMPAPIKAFAFSMGGLAAALTAATLIMSSYEALQVQAKINSAALAILKAKEAVANLTLAGSLTALGTAAQVAGNALMAASKALIPIAALVGTAALGVKQWESSVKPVNNVRDAIELLNQELNKTGSEGVPNSATAFDKLGRTLTRIGTDIKAVWETSIFSGATSAARGLATETGNLQSGLNTLANEFLNLKQAGLLNTKTARDLIPALEAAKNAISVLQAEGIKNKNVSADQLLIWQQSQMELTGYIDSINSANPAIAKNTDSLEENKGAIRNVKKEYEALATGLDTAISESEKSIRDKLIAVNNDIKLSAEERSAAVSNIESQGAEERIAIIENFINKRKQITGLNKEQEAENQKEILALEEEAGNLRVEISKTFASQREEAEKQVIERLRAQREAALQEELRGIEQTTAAYQQQANDRIQFQTAIIEGLDDETDSLNLQLKLLQESATTADLLGQSRIAAIDRQIEGYQNASNLIQAINSGELTRQQTILAQNELRELGLTQSSTDEQIQKRIQAAQEARRQVELANLLQQQESQRKQLEIQQELERVALRRQVAEAEIALINAQLAINLAQQNVLRAQAEASAANLELIEARRNRASDAELINLRSQLAAKTGAITLAQQQVALSEQQAGLSSEQLRDAKDAVGESEKLFDVQTKNLTIQHKQALESKLAADEADRLKVALGGAGGAADGANRAADGLERGAGAAERTASAIERSVAASKSLSSIESSRGGTNEQAKAAKDALQNLPSLRTVSTSGGKDAGTQYFIGNQQVSREEYNKEVGSRQKLRSIASKSRTQSWVTLGVPEDASARQIEAKILELERYQEHIVKALTSGRSVIGVQRAQEMLEGGAVDQQIKLLEKRLSAKVSAAVKATKVSAAVKATAVNADYARSNQEIKQCPNQEIKQCPLVTTELRASGGPVRAGVPYIVGERRPELFVPKVNGTIVPRVPSMPSMARVESLLTQLVNRPAPVLNNSATFINEPQPLQAQVALLQGQLRASRGAY